jgi:type I restriction enzyme, S subunit
VSAYPQLTIDEFCVTGSGGTPSRANREYYGGSIPWVKSGELREDVITDTEEKITERAISESSAKIVPSGAILLAMYGATVGRMAFLGIDAATNQAVCNIRPDLNKAFPRYVFHCLQSKINHFLSRAAGGAQPNISQGIIRETKIPLPPLNEQRRIAAILDKADVLRRKRKHTLDLLDGLTQSIFLEIFGSSESNPKGWKWGRIGDLLESTQYGTSEKAGENGKYPILRMGNLTSDGRTVFDDLKYIDLDDKDLDKFTLRRGDILFNRTNSAELVGKTAVFDSDEPFAFAGYLVRARVRSGGSPHYISGYLNSKHGKATLRGMAKSIVGMANINAKEMQAIPILLPDVQTQNTYSKALFSLERSRSECRRHLKSLSSLFSSLQSRAFSGQL